MTLKKHNTLMKFIKDNLKRKESTIGSINKGNGIMTARSVPFIRKRSLPEEAVLSSNSAMSSNKKIKAVFKDIRLTNQNKV